MSEVKMYHIPNLAVVTINNSTFVKLVEVRLDPSYRGDLNDLEQNNGLPELVLFRGDSAQALSDPMLNRFLEVLHHWDFDQDGNYDADEVSNSICNALWDWREKVDEFHRPSDSMFTRALMKIMPPQPERHIVMGYGDLRRRYKRVHYHWAIPMIIGFLVLFQLQVRLIPATKYSLVSGLGASASKFGVLWTIAGVVLLLLIFNLLFDRGVGRSKNKSSLSKYTFGYLNKAAVYEEQAFREGSESWSNQQRFISCLAFGTIHLSNLIYPVATIIPLCIGGAIFMHHYLKTYEQSHFRRDAVLHAAVMHRLYNKVALTVALVYVVVLLVSSIMGGVIALLSVLIYRGVAMVIGSFVPSYRNQQMATELDLR